MHGRTQTVFRRLYHFEEHTLGGGDGFTGPLSNHFGRNRMGRHLRGVRYCESQTDGTGRYRSGRLQHFRSIDGGASKFGRAEGSRQLPGRMKDDKAKHSKDRKTQNRKNRAYNFAAKRLCPSENPAQTHPEKCGAYSEEQKGCPGNISRDWKFRKHKKIANEGQDTQQESQPYGPVPAQPSHEIVPGSASQIGRNVPSSNSPNSHPLRDREYHYHLSNDSHNPFSAST